MKKILSIILILLSLSSFAQPSNSGQYQKMYSRWEQKFPAWLDSGVYVKKMSAMPSQFWTAAFDSVTGKMGYKRSTVPTLWEVTHKGDSTDLAIDARNSVDVYNIRNAGADNTGATNVSTFIAAAFAAGKKTIYLPTGTYLISTQIQMPDSAVIMGAGRDRTFIKLSSNITAFKCSNVQGGDNVTFKDFSFKGNFPSGNTSQRGIVMDTVIGCQVVNVGSNAMSGYAVSIKGNAFSPASFDGYSGNLIDGCFFKYGYGAVFFDTRAEFNIVTNTTILSCTYGVRVGGGNNRVNDNNITFCSWGLYYECGSNCAHGIVDGNHIAHNTLNLYVTGVGAIGQTFSDNNWYSGTMTIENSSNIYIQGGDFGMSTVTVNNCTNTNFIDNRFYSTPTWVITGNAPCVTTVENGTTAGRILRDVKNNKESQMYLNNDSLVIGKAGNNVAFTKINNRLLVTAPTSGNLSTAAIIKNQNVGTIFGSYTTNFPAIWSSAVGTPDFTNYAFMYPIGTTYINSTGNINFSISDVSKAGINTHGLSIGSGSAVAGTNLRITNVTTQSSSVGSISIGTNFTGTGLQPYLGSTRGTVNAVNTIANTNPNFADWQHKGQSRFKVDSVGTITTSGALEFGGNTSASPELLRNGTKLVARLADNSENTNFQVKDTVYSGSWGGSNDVPTKNAIYNKIESIPTLVNGTYTPTVSNLTNISSTTLNNFQYMRVGQVVTVSGSLYVTITTTLTITNFALSLPIASNFTNLGDAGGSGAGDSPSLLFPSIASASNDNVILECSQPIPTGSRYISVHFTYTIK